MPSSLGMSFVRSIPPRSYTTTTTTSSTPTSSQPIIPPPTIPQPQQQPPAAVSVPPTITPSSTYTPPDPLLTQLTNSIMRKGNKTVALANLREALFHIQTKSNNPNVSPISQLKEAIDKCSPLVKIVSMKQGGKNVQRPVPLTEKQKTRQGILWLIDAASQGQGARSFGTALGAEVLGVLNGQSGALTKRMQAHKNALSNRSNVVMRDRRAR